MERLTSSRPVEDIFDDVIANQTSLVELFMPKDAEEQKRAFLAGEVHNPTHIYDRLAAHEYVQREAKLAGLEEEIAQHPEILPHHVVAYQDYVTESRLRNKFAKIAAGLHAEGLTSFERQKLEEEFMELNVLLFGTPDEHVYNAIIQGIRSSLSKRPSDARTAQIWDALHDFLPEGNSDFKPFSPSDETKEWVRAAALQLYYPLLRHVPKRGEKFGSEDIAKIFTAIIETEFGDTAAEWKVELREAKAITVRSAEKLIVVPKIGRLAVGYERMRGHVAHELGVHFFRSIMGGQTDMPLLRIGLSGNGDNEEGLASVIEQAVENDFKDPSEVYPLIAGLMYYGHKDFRECFEILWRQRLMVQMSNTDEMVTDEAISQARDWAYYAVNRITRGTDTLPWFKDLSYYNGMQSMWRHLEAIRGDDVQLNILLQGKADPTRPAHRRLILDAKTA